MDEVGLISSCLAQQLSIVHWYMLVNCSFYPDDKADILKMIINDVKSYFSKLKRRAWTSNRPFTASSVFIVEDSQSP